MYFTLYFRLFWSETHSHRCLLRWGSWPKGSAVIYRLRFQEYQMGVQEDDTTHDGVGLTDLMDIGFSEESALAFFNHYKNFPALQLNHEEEPPDTGLMLLEHNQECLRPWLDPWQSRREPRLRERTGG